MGKERKSACVSECLEREGAKERETKENEQH